MASGGLDYELEKAFQAEIESITESVLRGDPEDYAAYKYQIGRVRGIQFAMTTLVDLRQKAGGEDGEF